METYASYLGHSSSQRAVAMVLALVSAVVLSPLYVNRRNEPNRFYETTRWSSGFVLPMVLAGLIVAIKTTSSSSSHSVQQRGSFFPSPDASSVLRIGSSSWGLAGVLILLMLVLSWQDTVQHFFWK